jgi:protein phosphatase
MTQFAASTHPGLKRNHNEDCYEANPDLGLWLVADGVGGHAHGEVASGIVRDTVHNGLKAGQSLTEAIKASHDAVLEEIRGRDDASNMGSTVVALKLDGNEYEIAWVGDSRAYAYDGKKLRQLTRDHNPVSEMQLRGILTPEQAAIHPERNVLSQSLGVSDEVTAEPDSVTGSLKPGEQIILCSDGLSDELTDNSIADIMGRETSPQTQVDALINGALNAGGSDNVTVVVVGAPPDKAPVAPLPQDLETTQNIGHAVASDTTARVSHSGKIWLLLGAMVILAAWLWF